MTPASGQSGSRSPLGEVRAEWAALRAELSQFAAARARLAQIEGRVALESLRRLVLAAVAGASLLLITVPLALVEICPAVDRRLALAPGTTLWITVASLALAGGAIVWFEVRKFRREFVGFRDTLAEFQEDQAWLNEWLAARGGSSRVSTACKGDGAAGKE